MGTFAGIFCHDYIQGHLCKHVHKVKAILMTSRSGTLQEADYGEHNTAPGPIFASTTSPPNRQLHGEYSL